MSLSLEKFWNCNDFPMIFKLYCIIMLHIDFSLMTTSIILTRYYKCITFNLKKKFHLSLAPKQGCGHTQVWLQLFKNVTREWVSVTHQMAVPVPSISCCVLNHHNLFYQIQNALAFNRDTCCHLALCLWLLPFHSFLAGGSDLQVK
jgi:hypothetical protein